MRQYVVDDPARQREVVTYKIEWFLIVGDKIAERRDWLGKYIPIVPGPARRRSSTAPWTARATPGR
jgi:hypothetical protein